MFLQLDLETLAQVISNELVRQSEAQEQSRLEEVPRNQAATNFNRVAPRQQQFQQRQQQQQPQQFQPRPQLQTQDQFSLGNQQPQQPQLTAQELRHFARAEAQISEAVRLQNCLANPSQCSA